MTTFCNECSIGIFIWVPDLDPRYAVTRLNMQSHRGALDCVGLGRQRQIQPPPPPSYHIVDEAHPQELKGRGCVIHRPENTH